MTLTVLKTFKDEVATDVAALAKDILERVESGEVVGIGVVLLLRDSSNWTRATATEERHRMLAGMVDLVCDYQRNK